MKSIDKHRKIIHSATKVFAKKGFFNARISDIAKEAKVADGTIYLYFNNKYDILFSVFEQEIGRLISVTNELLTTENSAKGKLEIFIRNHLEEMKKNRYLAEIIHIELRQAVKIIREYKKNTFNEYLELITAIIEQGQQDSTFRQDIHSGIARQIIFGALDEISTCWHTGNPSPYSIEDLSGQIASLFQAGLLTPSS
jgi:TetR/AcrR family fatty acid metabolism transcriptional regulator